MKTLLECVNEHRAGQARLQAERDEQERQVKRAIALMERNALHFLIEYLQPCYDFNLLDLEWTVRYNEVRSTETNKAFSVECAVPGTKGTIELYNQFCVADNALVKIFASMSRRSEAILISDPMALLWQATNSAGVRSFTYNLVEAVSALMPQETD